MGRVFTLQIFHEDLKWPCLVHPIKKENKIILEIVLLKGESREIKPEYYSLQFKDGKLLSDDPAPKMDLKEKIEVAILDYLKTRRLLFPEDN